MNKAIFLDRDGVLNVDSGYVYKVKDFEVIEGVYESLKFFTKLGFKLIVITNQSGIGRGLYSEDDFSTLNRHMLALFKKSSIEITDTFYCPHAPSDNCLCRKPKTGLIDLAVSMYNIDRSESYLVGDKLSDIQAGEDAGLAKSFLVGVENGNLNAVNRGLIFDNLLEITKRWLEITKF